MAGRKRDVEARGKPQRLLLGKRGWLQLLRHRGEPDTDQAEPGSTGRQGGRHPPDAPGVSYHAEYSAVGKAHDTGKDVTEVRSPHRKLLPDTVGPDPQEPTSLRG